MRRKYSINLQLNFATDVLNEKIDYLKKEITKLKIPVRYQKKTPNKIQLVSLGAFTNESLEKVKTQVNELSREVQPIESSLDSVSYFYTPKIGNDSLIFINVADPNKEVRMLYKNLFNRLTNFFFSPPVHLDPHFPLCMLIRQMKEHDQRNLLDKAQNIDFGTPIKFLFEKIEIAEIINNNFENYNENTVFSYKLGTS